MAKDSTSAFESMREDIAIAENACNSLDAGDIQPQEARFIVKKAMKHLSRKASCLIRAKLRPSATEE